MELCKRTWSSSWEQVQHWGQVREPQSREQDLSEHHVIHADCYWKVKFYRTFVVGKYQLQMRSWRERTRLLTAHHLTAIVSLDRSNCDGSERGEELEPVPEDGGVLQHQHVVVQEDARVNIWKQVLGNWYVRWRTTFFINTLIPI